MGHIIVPLGFVGLLARHSPVAEHISKSLRLSDLVCLMLTCSSLRNVLRLYTLGLARKPALKIDDDFARLRRVLKCTNSYIELDSTYEWRLLDAFEWRRRQLTRQLFLFVPGCDYSHRVDQLKRYLRELGYQICRETPGRVSFCF
jgi:hypothetical protein